MAALGKLFYIALFLSMAGGTLSLAALLLGRVLHLTLPRWFLALLLAACLIPVCSPEVLLFSPERTVWIDGYLTAAVIWAAGGALGLAVLAVRACLAGRALRRCLPCTDARVLTLAGQCARAAGLRRVPAVRFGTLPDPACVTGLLRPTVLLNRDAARALSDNELRSVLSHEMTHIRRGHLLLERLADLVCALHWFNPLIWLVRPDISLHCETDCDRAALRTLRGAVSPADYARTMLRLLEYSAGLDNRAGTELGALRFLHVRQRMRAILARPARWRTALTAALLAALLLVAAAGSVCLSRDYFYPYPASMAGPEYADPGPACSMPN